MMMIIAHHAVLHGGGVGMDFCVNKWFALFIFPGGKICFDTFIAISCWFLVEQSFQAERFMKMYIQALLYSVVTTIAALMLGSQLSLLEIISAFLPITGGVQGYAQTYLAFYLLLPFLSKLSRDLTKNQNIFIVIILAIFCFLYRFISSLTWSEQSVYCRLILFVFIYFLMLYIKRNPINWLDNTWIMLGVFVVGWLLIFGYNVGVTLYPHLSCWPYIGTMVGDEGGVLYLLTGLSFFFFFKSIKMKSVRWINGLASTTFAVILIHDGHFFRGWTWSLLHTTEWFYSKSYLFGIIIGTIGIYLICTLIDFIRKSVIERPMFKTKCMKKICNKWDELLIDKEI